MVSFFDSPKEGVKTILEAVKRLEEEEKVFKRMVRARRLYYPGYLPASFKVVANKRLGLATLGGIFLLRT